MLKPEVALRARAEPAEAAPEVIATAAVRERLVHSLHCEVGGVERRIHALQPLGEEGEETRGEHHIGAAAEHQLSALEPCQVATPQLQHLHGVGVHSAVLPVHTASA